MLSTWSYIEFVERHHAMFNNIVGARGVCL
jgi:hypothetical protein